MNEKTILEVVDKILSIIHENKPEMSNPNYKDYLTWFIAYDNVREKVEQLKAEICSK